MRVTSFSLAASLAFALTLTACGSSTSEGCGGGSCGGAAAKDPSACGLSPKTGEIPCDVFAVLHQHCHSCHGDPTAKGAPFPLLTYADTQEPYGSERLVFHQMYYQTQPGAGPRMPINDTLTAAEQKTLDDWLLACAPPAKVGEGCACPGNGCD